MDTIVERGYATSGGNFVVSEPEPSESGFGKMVILRGQPVGTGLGMGLGDGHGVSTGAGNRVGTRYCPGPPGV